MRLMGRISDRKGQKFPTDLTNSRFGKLTVLYRESEKRNRIYVWRCKCDCRNERSIVRCSLTSGCSTSCGCLKQPPFKQRIINNTVVDTNGCWNWIGKLDKGGYAICTFKNKRTRMHRATYEFYKGSFEKTKLICHKCDNRKCINPDHLYVGTHKDNAIDMVVRKRQNLTLGSAHQNSIFDEKTILLMRKEYSEGILISELSRKYKSAYRNVWKIIRRQTWKHI